MKYTSYLKWTDDTLTRLNVTWYLNQDVEQVVDRKFIPQDPAFLERLSNLEFPGPKHGGIFEDLNQMHPGMDACSDFLLTKFLGNVHGPGMASSQNTPNFELHSTVRAWAPRKCWQMGNNDTAWRAPHLGCIAAHDTRINRDASSVHVICGRAYSYLLMSSPEQLEETEEEDEPLDLIVPSEEQRKDGIAKDAALLFSQVADGIKSPNDIVDCEAFVWGMCDTKFYITCGHFDAAYIEVARTLPAPLPPRYTAEVRRTVFYDVSTVEGRREALRAAMGLLCYVEAREINRAVS